MKISPKPFFRGLAALAVVFGGANLAARAGYRALLYPAPKVDHARLPDSARLLDLRAADGVRVSAAYFPAPGSGPATPHIVIFHGNGEALGHGIDLAQDFVAAGVSVALLEYRGYGRSADEGSPTEQGLYADARCLIEWLKAQGVDESRLSALGISLGTGVATQMAFEHRVHSLVLVSPYTSIPAMARRFAPFLPTSLIVNDRFDSQSKAPTIARPVLIVHGTEDELIPFEMGATLAATFPTATMRSVLHGHHNDLFAKAPELVTEIAAFVSR